MERIRIRYGKRGRLRFASHRDFARAFERALRRAAVPVAYSGGFSPRPRVSYLGAAPTGAASDAEYLEIAMARECDPESVRAALDAALPPGLDVLEAVEARHGKLAERITGSRWLIEVPGVDREECTESLAAFLLESEVLVSRLTKSGRKDVDVRGPLVAAHVRPGALADDLTGKSAIIEIVVRHATPTIRPDDLLRGINTVTGLHFPEPARARRVAQGTVDDDGAVSDPLDPDRQ